MFLCAKCGRPITQTLYLEIVDKHGRKGKVIDGKAYCGNCLERKQAKPDDKKKKEKKKPPGRGAPSPGSGSERRRRRGPGAGPPSRGPRRKGGPPSISKTAKEDLGRYAGSSQEQDRAAVEREILERSLDYTHLSTEPPKPSIQEAQTPEQQWLYREMKNVDGACREREERIRELDGELRSIRQALERVEEADRIAKDPAASGIEKILKPWKDSQSYGYDNERWDPMLKLAGLEQFTRDGADAAMRKQLKHELTQKMHRAEQERSTAKGQLASYQDRMRHLDDQWRKSKKR
jgi:hypothetical protein